MTHCITLVVARLDAGRCALAAQIIRYFCLEKMFQKLLTFPLDDGNMSLVRTNVLKLNRLSLTPSYFSLSQAVGCPPLSPSPDRCGGMIPLNLNAKPQTRSLIRLLIGTEAISICPSCRGEELCQ